MSGRTARVCTALALGVVLAAAGCTGHRLAHAYPLGSQSGGPPRPGGRAVFVREGDQDYIDPALSYELYSSPVVMGVNRMLLDYVNEPGVAGTRRVPGLATSLPTITDDGTLYAFRVRPDARFAQPIGRHIVAADFKYALERLFRVGSPGVDFFRHIVGAANVLAGRDTALAGVIARGDSLYIRLERPDPVFLSVLSMTFAAPLPREAVPAVSGAFPTTIASGPFRIAEFSPRQRVVLVKNPDYCGSPAWLDTVEVRFGVTTSNGVAMIRRGAADGGLFEVPAAEYGRLRNDPSWRPQLDVADGLNTTFMFMNVRMKPFNDVRVRQAVAWAVDRRIAVKTYSGKASIAGEVLPPSMPGSLQLGRYPGPDLARARRLLAEAGYPHGFSTMLYAGTEEPWPRLVTVIQQELAEIGIRATLDFSEFSTYFAMIGDTTRHVPFGMFGWYADYPDPSNFFDTLLNGHRITAIHNNNNSMFDDATVNAMIERAMVTRDDSSRVRLWQDVDRSVMDEVPMVPMVHALESRLYAPRLGGWYRHLTCVLKLESLYIKSDAPGAVAGSHAEQPR